MSTLRERVGWQYRYFAEQSAKYFRIEEVLRELDLLDVNTYDVYFSTYGELTVTIRPKHVLGLLADFQTVVDTTPTLADAAKFWLPKVGKWEKGFNGESNEITLTGEYKGVRIVLIDATPDTCTVEKVEEVVDLPAHSYVRRKYVLKGDCDPLLASQSAEGAVSLSDNEVPF